MEPKFVLYSQNHLLFNIQPDTEPRRVTDANDPVHNPDSVGNRVTAILAVQCRLGILPERRNRTNPVDRHNSRPLRTDLDAVGGTGPLAISGQ